MLVIWVNKLLHLKNKQQGFIVILRTPICVFITSTGNTNPKLIIFRMDNYYSPNLIILSHSHTRIAFYFSKEKTSIIFRSLRGDKALTIPLFLFIMYDILTKSTDLQGAGLGDLDFKKNAIII